ncbi:MAG: PDZ domain-containing protein [Candidatus Hydrogenedentes bacterium]|nr:PDZ domain-containing protein [Candidatus Hydrogenedentota bacterium]
MNKTRGALIGIVLGLASWAAPSQAAVSNDGFTQSVIVQAHERLTPTVGILQYSSEITNQNTGEITKRDSSALALVVSAQGLVMAHGHMVLEDNQPFNIKITLGQGSDEKEYEAELLEKPEDVNIAFLQLKSDTPLNLPYVRFAPGRNLSIGEPVMLFGVFGETLDNVVGLWEGRIGAIIEKPRRTYCLDSAVRFGFVTGPVVNRQGEVAGVVGFDLTQAEGGDLYVRSGHPLVYQADLFTKYIENPPSKESLAQGDDAWLGVFTQPLTEDFQEYWKLDHSGGLIVSTVVPASPAATAGLQLGDIIIDFNGTPIKARQDRDVIGFTKLVRETGAGAATKVTVLRGTEKVEIPITLGVRPRSSADADEFEDKIFGMTVREITQDIRIRLNLTEDVQGVIVRRVTSGSTAEIAKIRPGVIILGMGDYPVRNLMEYQEAVEKIAAAKPAELTIFARVGTATGFFRLQPRWEP